MSFYCTKQATVRRKLDNGSLFYVSFPESRRPVFVPCTRLKRPIAHAVSLISTRDTEWALSIQKHHQNTSKEKTNAMSSLSN